MILIEKTQIMGLEPTIRGMRNPMNSWAKSDSDYCDFDGHGDSCPFCKHLNYCDMNSKPYIAGEADHDLMLRLAKAGSVDGKFRRMIAVYVDLTAPLYWWKEFDTYKVGTVANSCSTMHKIHAKEFTLEDFSCDHLMRDDEYFGEVPNHYTFGDFKGCLEGVIGALNDARALYLKTNDKKYWWQMIQLLPSSYNQKRTVMLNYEVLANIYQHRRNHKLDEWREVCRWIESLPYSEIITCNAAEKDKANELTAAMAKLRAEGYDEAEIMKALRAWMADHQEA